MGRKNSKKCKTKEEIGDDFCFICKDGGLLRFCDFKDCLKAYHPECVGREESFVESEDRWICDWHSCFLCRKTSKFRCVGCPQAVCGRCIFNAEFVCVRGSRGFCNHCLKLALLIEDGKDADIDGTKVDFNDRETYECLFKEYWELMKKKEGLTAEHVHTASNLLKKGRNYRCDFNSNEIEESEEDTDEYELSSDYEELVYTEEGHALVKKCKRRKEKLGSTRKKMKSSNKEFIGWGSKPVIDFLSKIGKDTSKKLTQHDVASIITAYCKENKLFHPQKKKRILCDAKLQSVFGRKIMNVNSVNKHLTAHFAENMEESSEDESTSSMEKDDNSIMACKRQRKLGSDRKPAEQNPSDMSHNCSAAIIAANIKLVYLKRSLVERLLEDKECFEGKMMGSFVRAKSDPNDYSQKNSYQLLQVTGIKIDSSNTGKQGILLQVANRLDYIPIYNLSDDDFFEEECEDLHQRVRNGLLRQPTLEELCEKAKSLHEDIIKHWIPKELARLQTCIDHANEKGWRRELFEYMEKRILLQEPSEQARLIHELPKVIADIPEPTFEDLLEKDEVNHVLVDRKDGRKAATAAEVEECLIGVRNISEKQQQSEVSTCKDFAKKSCISAVEFQTRDEQHQSILPKEHVCSNPSWNNIQSESINVQESKLKNKNASEVQLSKLKKKFDSEVHLIESKLKNKKASEVQLIESKLKNKNASEVQLMQSKLKNKIASDVQLVESKLKNKNASDVQMVEPKLKNKNASEVQLIELSDDDEDLRVEEKMQNLENPNVSMWYCASPQGETRGPLPMSLLKQWRDSSSFELKCKVWKSDQSSQDAILLSDAIRVLGYGIPTGLMFCSIVLFFMGTRVYVFIKPEGSIFTGLAQVAVAAYKKRHLKLPDDRKGFYDPPLDPDSVVLSKLPLTNQFSFLNKAAIITEKEINPDGTRVNKWNVSSIQQVEELKCLFRVFPIWVTGILSLTPIIQQSTFSISQALQMNRHMGPNFQIPPASIIVISFLTITFFIPFYDQFLVPTLRKFTRHPNGITELQRMAVGIIFAVVSMVVAGLIEMQRRNRANNGGSIMSVFWLTPQFFLMGLCEAFNIIGQIEFFNKEFPEHMRTMGNAFSSCSIALSSYVNTAMVLIVHRTTGSGGAHGRPDWLVDDLNKGRLDYFYYVVAATAFCNFFFFLYCAKNYRYKGHVSNTERDLELVISSDKKILDV